MRGIDELIEEVKQLQQQRAFAEEQMRQQEQQIRCAQNERELRDAMRRDLGDDLCAALDFSVRASERKEDTYALFSFADRGLALSHHTQDGYTLRDAIDERGFMKSSNLTSDDARTWLLLALDELRSASLLLAQLVEEEPVKPSKKSTR